MASQAQQLVEAFEHRFGTPPDLFRAPGRVNLIGEHTDYNLGFVLPIAIDLACYAAWAPNSDGILRVYSQNFEEGKEWPVADIASLQPMHHWTDYIIGVVRQIPHLTGGNLMLHSTVPVGAGLSSSAALEVSVALAAGWRGGDKMDLVKLCRRAENDFVGLPSGIMDQYVCVFGRQQAAVKIDCRSLHHQDVRLPDGSAIVAVNSMVKHQLSKSAYHDRVAECARAVEQIGFVRPEVESLRDASPEDLNAISDAVARRRAHHIITENARVEQFVEASLANDLVQMGKIFQQSHASLRDDYEVSCSELDFLAATAESLPGVFGARMTGAGFGGCTVNLLSQDSVDSFEFAIRDAYHARFGIHPAVYRVEAAAGAGRIS